MSLNSFSQADTKTVCLPSKIARQAAKDLVRYDGCVVENNLLTTVVNKLEERDEQKDTIIDLLKDKDQNNQFMIQQKDLQIQQYEKLTDDLTKEVKSKRRSTLFWKVTTGAATFLSVFLVLK